MEIAGNTENAGNVEIQPKLEPGIDLMNTSLFNNNNNNNMNSMNSMKKNNVISSTIKPVKARRNRRQIKPNVIRIPPRPLAVRTSAPLVPGSIPESLPVTSQPFQVKNLI